MVPVCFIYPSILGVSQYWRPKYFEYWEYEQSKIPLLLKVVVVAVVQVAVAIVILGASSIFGTPSTERIAVLYEQY